MTTIGVRRYFCAAVILAMVVPLPGVAGAAVPKAANSQVADGQEGRSALAFDKLKTLVGVWRVADNEKSRLRIRFYLTAGDTVLVESWEKAGAPYSLTVYHRDGPSLLATHYCSQGNQPRLMLKAAEGAVMRFVFKDATDLAVDTEFYRHDLSFDLSNSDMILRGKTYYKGDEASSDMLRLVRVK